MSARTRTRMSAAEYLEWDRQHPSKHEFVNGEMWAMAGAHPVHNLLTANLIAVLHLRLRGSPCYPLSPDMRVLVEETGLYCYPDISVVCGPPQTRGTHPPTLLNPTLLVEVLSESTAHLDKDVKFAHYRRRESVQAVVFVSWPERRVEVYTRHPDGWRLTEARDAEVLALPCIGVELPLAEVYERMEVVAGGLE